MDYRTSEEPGNFDSGVISMDFEDVKASYYDVMRLYLRILSLFVSS